MLTVIDEYTRACLAIEVGRKLCSDDVLHCLSALFARHGAPDTFGPITGRSLPLRLSGTGYRESG